MMILRRLSRLLTPRALGLLTVIFALALLMAGCDADTPQNTFAPEGPVADKQRDIFLLAMWPAIVILIGVELAIIVILVRFRRRREDEVPKQTHGNTQLELAWTVAPAILLLVLAVPMMDILFDLGREPDPDAYVINVTGQQWIWSFEYPEELDENGKPLVARSEFHFPAGRDVRFNLMSVDVIHSFAIPRLAGTLDVVPGETNTLWIRADRPGTYAGQCREFCGVGHADMRMIAHADSEADFEAWLQQKLGGGKEEEAPTPAPVATSSPTESQ